MKLIITATGPALDDAVDPRFGRARYFVLVDDATGETTAHSNEVNLQAAQGAGIQAAQTVRRSRRGSRPHGAYRPQGVPRPAGGGHPHPYRRLRNRPAGPGSVPRRFAARSVRRGCRRSLVKRAT